MCPAAAPVRSPGQPHAGFVRTARLPAGGSSAASPRRRSPRRPPPRPRAVADLDLAVFPRARHRRGEAEVVPVAAGPAPGRTAPLPLAVRWTRRSVRSDARSSSPARCRAAAGATTPKLADTATPVCPSTYSGSASSWVIGGRWSRCPACARCSRSACRTRHRRGAPRSPFPLPTTASSFAATPRSTLVPELRAESVGDLREAVEVEVEQRDAGGGVGQPQQFLQPGAEELPVRQPGQRVVQRLVAQSPLQQRNLGVVVDDRDRAAAARRRRP